MHVEREFGELAHRLDYFGAESQIRDEASVHDVDVDPVRAAILEHRDVVGEFRKVGAQNRWSDPNAHSRLGGDGGGAVIPVSILIDGGGGKCDTVRLTGPPAEMF